MRVGIALLAIAGSGIVAQDNGAANAPKVELVKAEDWRASTLRPGDVLSISVFRVPEFSKNVRIDEDGTFIYPMCGEIEAAGKTVRAIAKELELKLKDQVAEPHVDIFVDSWANRTVYILGEVQSSKSLELPKYSKMTALQAISAAGGFTQYADLNNVAVLRRRPDDDSILERIKIDVSALVSKTSGGDDFKLHPEDTLIIPKAPPIYLTGAVGSPGVYYVDTQRLPLCSELIVRAGGLSLGADIHEIRIVRPNENDERSTIISSMQFREPGIYDNDQVVQPGDYVFVGTADHIYVLGCVGKPGPLTLGPYSTVTASRAVAMAGGFTNVAKTSDITLIRGNEMISINLKKLYNSFENMERDITLKPGDILFVKESMW